MTDFTAQATIDACDEFEVLSRNMGVVVKHYHCDNGRFANSKFISHCKQRHISVTYCGVNAHYQNGVAERTIGILRDEARVALWHAVFRWPSMLMLNLWPYAICNAAEIRNSLPSSNSGRSPLEMYSKSSVGTNFKDLHTLFCPVYQLNSDLASGKKIQHWEPRSRLGINLGCSPRHARNVNLVLNPSTGFVSPQFHVAYDDFVESIRLGKDNESQLPLWQELSGLKKLTRPARPVDIALTRRRQDATKDSLASNSQNQVTNEESSHTLDGEVNHEEHLHPPPSTVEGQGEGLDTHTSNERVQTEEQPDEGPMSFLSSTTRSGRKVKPAQKVKEIMERGDITALESIFIDGSSDDEIERYYDALHMDDSRRQEGSNSILGEI